MKIAVCDDELTVREHVSDIIKTYFDERKRNAELTLYESGRKMIEDKEAYDIIFLDIEMPEINGIETAEALRKWDVRSKIICLTNYSNFKSHAYKVHAFDYLCKPIKEEAIYAVLNEAVRYLEEAEVSPEIFFKTSQGGINLRINEIYYFEYCARELSIVCERRRYTSASYSLKQLYEKLCRYHFEMPHKSFIVNMLHIKDIKGADIRMDNGDTVPLAQKRSVAFKNSFNDFLQTTFKLF